MSYSGLGTESPTLKLTAAERTALYDRAVRVRDRLISLNQRCSSIIPRQTDDFTSAMNATNDQIRTFVNSPIRAFDISEFEGIERQVLSWECPASSSSGVSPLVWVGLGVAALGIGFVVFRKTG